MQAPLLQSELQTFHDEYMLLFEVADENAAYELARELEAGKYDSKIFKVSRLDFAVSTPECIYLFCHETPVFWISWCRLRDGRKTFLPCDVPTLRPL